MSTKTRVSKKFKTSCEVNNDEDFISDLPETVMCLILSLLPTVECVRTSILSKDWEYKWTSVDHIDVKDRKHVTGQAENDATSFVKYMDNIVQRTQNLRSFHLSCADKYKSRDMKSWIIAALKCKTIESFELQIYDPEGFVLPCHLLSKPSLRKLMLTCTLKVFRENKFPNLTYLRLSEVEIVNGNPRHNCGRVYGRDQLGFFFPVLKTLELIRCKWVSVYMMEICSPTLSSFTCESRAGWRPILDVIIKIQGASLAKFEHSGSYVLNIDLKESTVLNAYLDNRAMRRDLTSGFEVRQVVKGFSGIMGLQLSSSICQAMNDAKGMNPLSSYGKLQRLVMYVEYDASLLLELLGYAPSLKLLEIYGVPQDFVCTEVESVPNCVASYLEEVTFTNTHIKPLIHLAAFFLKNGTALEKIHVRRYNDSWRNEIWKHLSSCPKAASESVVVNFITPFKYIIH